MLSAPALRRAARQLAGRADADDLVQECFVVAIRRADEFAPGGRLLPWLLGILQNRARSRHRWRWRRLRQPSHADAAEHQAIVDDGPDLVERDDWFRSVAPHLERLSEPYRTVVTEHVVGGVPLVELAARLGRPANTVRSQFARGLQDLRRRLPAPLLIGLAAILATRSGTTAAPGGPWKRVPARALAAAALVAVCVVIWSATGAAPGHAAAAATQPPASAMAAPVADVPSPTANERVLASAPAAPGVSVRLHYPDGQPAAGVRVIFEPDFTPGLAVNRACRSWRFATTDAAGDAHFAVDGRGSAAIRVHDMDVLHRFEKNDAPRSFSFTIPPAPELIVELIDPEGQPIAGGTVFFSGAKGLRAPGFPAATTDAEGKARIRCVLPAYTIWATAPGHAVTATYSGHTDTSASLRSIATLPLERSWQRVCGTVVGDTGAAVTNATVAVWSEPLAAWPRLYASTDAAGRFAIDGLHAGPWSAAAVAPGLACAVAERLDPTEQPVLRLTRGGEVRGRVEVPTHAVRSALRVVSYRSDGNASNPLDSVGSPVADDGSFRLPCLAAGEHRVGFFEQAPNPTMSCKVTVTEGATAEIAFAVSESLVWELRVVDELGQPRPDHLVLTESALDLVGLDYVQKARTDARGIARFAVTDDAPKWVFVYPPRGAGTDVVPTVALGPVTPRSLTTITLPESACAPCRLRGRLPADYTAPGVTPHLELARIGGTRKAPFFLDRTFRADQLPAGDYHLRLRRTWDGGAHVLSLAYVSLKPGDDVDLGELPCFAFGEVELALAVDGSTSGVAFFVKDGKGHGAEAGRLECGKPVRCQLPAGRYSVEYADSDASVHERAFEVVAESTARVEVQRTPGVPCRIEVATADPIVARLWTSLQGTDQKPWVFMIPPPEDGRTWSVDLDLRPGVYRFTALRGDGGELHETLVVGAGGGRQTFPFRLR